MITLSEITEGRRFGGRKRVSVLVTYAYPGEESYAVPVTFVGPEYGTGPVVLVTADMPGGTHVVGASRFGDFGPEWVRRFYASEEN